MWHRVIFASDPVSHRVGVACGQDNPSGVALCAVVQDYWMWCTWRAIQAINPPVYSLQQDRPSRLKNLNIHGIPFVTNLGLGLTSVLFFKDKFISLWAVCRTTCLFSTRFISVRGSVCGSIYYIGIRAMLIGSWIHGQLICCGFQNSIPSCISYAHTQVRHYWRHQFLLCQRCSKLSWRRSGGFNSSHPSLLIVYSTRGTTSVTCRERSYQREFIVFWHGPATHPFFPRPTHSSSVLIWVILPALFSHCCSVFLSWS